MFPLLCNFATCMHSRLSDDSEQMLVSDRDVKVSASQCITSSCNDCSSLVRLAVNVCSNEPLPLALQAVSSLSISRTNISTESNLP